MVAVGFVGGLTEGVWEGRVSVFCAHGLSHSCLHALAGPLVSQCLPSCNIQVWRTFLPRLFSPSHSADASPREPLHQSRLLLPSSCYLSIFSFHQMDSERMRLEMSSSRKMSEKKGAYCVRGRVSAGVRRWFLDGGATCNLKHEL